MPPRWLQPELPGALRSVWQTPPAVVVASPFAVLAAEAARPALPAVRLVAEAA